MSKPIRTPEADDFCDAVLSLRSRDECYRFFQDVCTVNEIASLSQRFAVAKMLIQMKNRPESGPHFRPRQNRISQKFSRFHRRRNTRSCSQAGSHPSVSAVCRREDADTEENLSGHRTKNRSIHRYHQPRQQGIGLRERRILHGSGTDQYFRSGLKFLTASSSGKPGCRPHRNNGQSVSRSAFCAQTHRRKAY